MNDDIPFPLLEKGDWVRLKSPYKPPRKIENGPLKKTLETLVEDRFEALDTEDSPLTTETVRPSVVKNDERFEDLFTFTHGIVVEVVTRYPERKLELPKSTVINYTNDGGGPPRNVALHLFNPETGLMDIGGHPTEPGKPEYIDMHVAELILVHKHNESWGNEYDIDLAEQYKEWGIEEPMAFDPFESDE